MVMELEEYEKFQLDPYSYLGINDMDVELDIEIVHEDDDDEAVDDDEAMSDKDESTSLASSSHDDDDAPNDDNDTRIEIASEPVAMARPTTAGAESDTRRILADASPQRGTLLPIHLTELCEAILDQCSLETGRLETSAPQAIADAFQVNIDTVYRIFKSILRSVAATGQIDPSYQPQRAQAPLSDINVKEAYSKLQILLQARSRGEREVVAAVPASTGVSPSASAVNSKHLKAQPLKDKPLAKNPIVAATSIRRRRNCKHVRLNENIGAAAVRAPPAKRPQSPTPLTAVQDTLRQAILDHCSLETGQLPALAPQAIADAHQVHVEMVYGVFKSILRSVAATGQVDKYWYQMERHPSPLSDINKTEVYAKLKTILQARSQNDTAPATVPTSIALRRPTAACTNKHSKAQSVCDKQVTAPVGAVALASGKSSGSENGDVLLDDDTLMCTEEMAADIASLTMDSNVDRRPDVFLDDDSPPMSTEETVADVASFAMDSNDYRRPNTDGKDIAVCPGEGGAKSHEMAQPQLTTLPVNPRLRDVLCQAILDHCSLETGRMPESAPKTIADAHSVDVVEVYGIFKCMLRSVVATERINPCYQQWRSQAALYDINLNEAYAKLQVMLQARSRNKAIAVVPAVRPQNPFPIAPRDVLCQDILDQCSLETGKIQSSALRAIADAHNVKVFWVRGVFRCILRSVAATGKVDPSYQMEWSQSALSDINVNEAYSKLQMQLQARSRDERVVSVVAVAASTEVSPLPMTLSVDTKLRDTLCQAILDHCSLETGRMPESAPKSIAEAHSVDVVEVYCIFKCMLRSVVARGQINPSYQQWRSGSPLSDINLSEAYAKLQVILQARSRNEAIAVVPAVQTPNPPPMALRDVLCQDILDRCSMETGKIQSSALQAIAHAHNVKVSRVRGVFRCILRSVAATGQVDPSYQMEWSRSALSNVNQKEAYTKLQTILRARSQNDAVPATVSTSIARSRQTAAFTKTHSKSQSVCDKTATTPVVAVALASGKSSGSENGDVLLDDDTPSMPTEETGADVASLTMDSNVHGRHNTSRNDDTGTGGQRAAQSRMKRRNR